MALFFLSFNLNNDFKNHCLNVVSDSQDDTTLVSSKTTIKNFKFSKSLFFGCWMFEPNEPESVISFNSKRMKVGIKDTLCYNYKINYDTITIYQFTNSQVSEGLIDKLTEDSLVIKWKTGDVNYYLRCCCD